ncbi:hypothetical protein GQ42DRAFT_156113 [Ramicandelaber brevisporus]|nr:hypothetical protein GQ42DRAFT_156113 [Ramicandelaber brevisporus]
MVFPTGPIRAHSGSGMPSTVPAIVVTAVPHHHLHRHQHRYFPTDNLVATSGITKPSNSSLVASAKAAARAQYKRESWNRWYSGLAPSQKARRKRYLRLHGQGYRSELLKFMCDAFEDPDAAVEFVKRLGGPAKALEYISRHQDMQHLQESIHLQQAQRLPSSSAGSPSSSASGDYSPPLTTSDDSVASVSPCMGSYASTSSPAAALSIQRLQSHSGVMQHYQSPAAAASRLSIPAQAIGIPVLSRTPPTSLRSEPMGLPAVNACHSQQPQQQHLMISPHTIMITPAASPVSTPVASRVASGNYWTQPPQPCRSNSTPTISITPFRKQPQLPLPHSLPQPVPQSLPQPKRQQSHTQRKSLIVLPKPVPSSLPVVRTKSDVDATARSISISSLLNPNTNC